jgi:predicted nucleotidyltransferase
VKIDFKHHIISDLAEFNPEKIILFGSYAGDNWDEESDIDIIVVYQTEKKFMDRLEELYMKWNLTKAVDILAYTPDEFKDMMKDNFFLKQAVKEGIIIYERT